MYILKFIVRYWLIFELCIPVLGGLKPVWADETPLRSQDPKNLIVAPGAKKTEITRKLALPQTRDPAPIKSKLSAFRKFIGADSKNSKPAQISNSDYNESSSYNWFDRAMKTGEHVEDARTTLQKAIDHGDIKAKEKLRELEQLFPSSRHGLETIRNCCEPIPSTTNKLSRFSPIDPYNTGSGDSWKFTKIVTSKDYIYKQPKEIGSKSWIEANISVRIPPKLSKETDKEYLLRRGLDLSGQKDQKFTFAGSGAMSWVYYEHGQVPSDNELQVIYKNLDPEMLAQRYKGMKTNEALSRYWISETSKEVIKVRKPEPFSGTLRKDEALAEAREMIRRDIVIQKLFHDLASQFKEVDSSGKKRVLIRAVEYNAGPKEISQGIFKQAAIHGPTAAEVANLLNKALYQHDANAERYLIDTLKFKSLTDAEKKIGLLEAFYAETHENVTWFERMNHLSSLGATMGKDETGKARKPVITGFDYNHGVNVIWNPKDQVFDAIDF